MKYLLASGLCVEATFPRCGKIWLITKGTSAPPAVPDGLEDDQITLLHTQQELGADPRDHSVALEPLTPLVRKIAAFEKQHKLILTNNRNGQVFGFGSFGPAPFTCQQRRRFLRHTAG